MKNDKPDNPTGNGPRDGRGRFAPGNAGGPGRPPSAEVLAFRRAFRNAISADDITAAAKELARLARSGDLDAIRELFDRCLGRPVSQDWSEEIADLREELIHLAAKIGGSRAA